MIDFLTNTLAFIFALGVIIFVHEFGHLLVAKLFDTRVLAFSLGFGKKLWGFRRGETEYKVSLVPLGGYVKLGGELPEESTGDARDFLSKPRWQRILVYLAGPAMNVILAVVLIAGVFMVGIEIPDLPNIDPVVGEVQEGSSAEEAGLAPGDRITEIEGKAVDGWQDVSFALSTSPAQPVALTVLRGEETLALTVTPAKIPKYELGDWAGILPVLRPRITQVVGGEPAEAAGFETADEIHSVDGRPISTSKEFVSYIEGHAGISVKVEVLRAERPTTLTVTPKDVGGVGKIGVGIGFFQRYSPGRAVIESVRYNLKIVHDTFAVLGKIFSRKLSAKGALAGPIEIAKYSGAAARSGLRNLVFLMGFISISIAVLNLLPIPILDGGQILILLVEGVIRRDLSLRLKEMIAQVGFVVIVLLMLVVIYFDLSKNLPEGLLPGS